MGLNLRGKRNKMGTAVRKSVERDEVLDIVTVIATGITDAATVAIAIFAIPTIIAYRKQVQIGQAQVKVSQEQLFNQFRPVLYPVGDLEKIVDRSAGKYHVIWEQQNQEVDGLKNIGVGPAFSIYGTLFGPPVNSQLLPIRYVV